MNTENTDKFFLALGGFAGFGTTFFAALSAGGDDVPNALLKSAVGMIVGTLLVKMLLSVAHSAFREASLEKKSLKKPSAEGTQKPETSTAATPSASPSVTQISSPPSRQEQASAPSVDTSAPSTSPVAAAPAVPATARPRPVKPVRNARVS